MAQDKDTQETLDTIDPSQTSDAQNPDAQNPDENLVSDPKPKRAYKPRASKVQSETLDASETPIRKPRRGKANIEKSAAQLEGIHKMVAMLPNMGFMAIAPEEARILAEAMAGVAEEYDIQISGKASASMQLLAAASMVYAPRVIHAVKVSKAKKMATDSLMTVETPADSVDTTKK